LSIGRGEEKESVRLEEEGGRSKMLFTCGGFGRPRGIVEVGMSVYGGCSVFGVLEPYLLFPGEYRKGGDHDL